MGRPHCEKEIPFITQVSSRDSAPEICNDLIRYCIVIQVNYILYLFFYLYILANSSLKL